MALVLGDVGTEPTTQMRRTGGVGAFEQSVDIVRSHALDAPGA